MKDYSQPEFYHFDQDSIKLASFAGQYMESERLTKSLRVLDLCSGCGVIGLEFLSKYPNLVSHLTFVEIQKEFIFHVEQNLAWKKRVLGKTFEASIQNTELSKFSTPGEKYNVILCNPPYYNEEKSRLPNDGKRRKCRFFSNGELNELLCSVERNLDEKGIAFFVLPENSEFEKLLIEKKINFKSEKITKDRLVLFVSGLNVNRL